MKRKAAFLFPGQGVQYVGMLQDIIQAYPVAMKTFDSADAILGRRISKTILTGPEEELNITTNTQPALYTCEIAILRILEENGIIPEIVAGFSLGEWAALTAAGSVEEEQALLLVQSRAQYMQEAVPVGEGGMAVILGKSCEDVENICARIGRITPSNYNCPGQITVSGEMAGIQALLQYAEQNGIAAKQLAISIPSHCSLMKPAAEKLKNDLDTLILRNTKIPIVMNCTGTAVTQSDDIRKNAIEQLTTPVRFEQSVKYMLECGIDAFIEVGPGKVLTGLVKKCAKAKEMPISVYRTSTRIDLETTIMELA